MVLAADRDQDRMDLRAIMQDRNKDMEGMDILKDSMLMIEGEGEVVGCCLDV
jgi:hypothetical protein